MPPNTLAEYYQGQNKSLPSLQERAPLYAQQGGQGEYQGTAEQNTFLLGKLLGSSTTPTPTPTQGSGTYAEDLATSLDTTGGSTTNAVGTSDAERARVKKEEIEKIKKELEPTTNQPILYKSADEYKKLRQEQGIVNDEAELAAIQNEASLGKEELRQFGTTAGEEMTEGGRIGAVSEKERNLNFRLEGLALRETAVLSRINSKNSYISNMLQLGQQDYTNAKAEYDEEYNKNLKAVELYNSEEDELKQDAIASISTITSLTTDKGILYDDLSEKLKTQISTLELQAGLPEGLIQQAMSVAPEDKIQSVSTRTDASGKEYFDILRISPDGGMYVQKVYRGQGEVAQPTTVKSGGLVIPEATIAQGQQVLDNTRGKPYINEKGETITPTGTDAEYVYTPRYLEMLEAWKADGGLEQDFFTNYPPKNYLNPDDTSVPKYLRDKLKVSTDGGFDSF